MYTPADPWLARNAPFLHHPAIDQRVSPRSSETEDRIFLYKHELLLLNSAIFSRLFRSGSVFTSISPHLPRAAETRLGCCFASCIGDENARKFWEDLSLSSNLSFPLLSLYIFSNINIYSSFPYAPFRTHARLKRRGAARNRAKIERRALPRVLFLPLRDSLSLSNSTARTHVRHAHARTQYTSKA